MPETGDLYASVGYLLAAAAITVASLVGYSALLAQRLSGARARNLELRGIPPGQQAAVSARGADTRLTPER